MRARARARGRMRMRMRTVRDGMVVLLITKGRLDQGHLMGCRGQMR